MKKRILAALMVLSMMLTGLGYVPVQAAGNGLTVTETEPVLPFHEIAEKDQLASAQNPDEIVEIIVGGTYFRNLLLCIGWRWQGHSAAGGCQCPGWPSAGSGCSSKKPGP